MKICIECGAKHYARGYCFLHYKRLWRNGHVYNTLHMNENSPCTVPGCERPAKTKSLCNMHYLRNWKSGDTGPAAAFYKPRGEGSSEYRTTTIDGKSYPQHVIIVETILGKELPEGAEIHHLNGDGKDNRHNNLVVCPNRAYHALLHKRQRELGWSGPDRLSESKFQRNSRLFWEKFSE